MSQACLMSPVSTLNCLLSPRWKCSQSTICMLHLSDVKWFVTLTHSSGSEDCPFPYLSDDSKDWSPDSPLPSRCRPMKVHSGTQTEGPPPSPVATAQPSLLVPAAPSLPSCPSPVPQRKQRHCAKWENRASVVHKEPEEESKPTYESLEMVSSVRTTPHTHYFKAAKQL